VNFGAAMPSSEEVARLRALLDGAGIAFRGIAGFDERLESLALDEGLTFEASREPPERRRERRSVNEGRLSDGARSLIADFAGARGDIAQRRRRGEASVPRLQSEQLRVRATTLHVVESPQGTLYHPSTLRGGQVLTHDGNIVVVGDVNPGAELIATGDVLVFGRLAGIAHAGAQGDVNARIYAIDLAATQLRIATFIAAEADAKRRRIPVAEAAIARDGRIVVLPLDRLEPRAMEEQAT
jgi:septum site-determining protein MinC